MKLKRRNREEEKNKLSLLGSELWRRMPICIPCPFLIYLVVDARRLAPPTRVQSVVYVVRQPDRKGGGKGVAAASTQPIRCFKTPPWMQRRGFSETPEYERDAIRENFI